MEIEDSQVGLGSRIRFFRSELGISQQVLANLVGLHRTYIADVERGSRNVSLQSIVRIAAGLNVSLADLFSGLPRPECGDVRRRAADSRAAASKIPNR